VLGSNRIPFSRHNTFYANANNQDMMIAALTGLIERFKLKGHQLGEVAGGAVIKHTREFNLFRECVLGSSLDPATPACDIQQACDTGVEAAIYIGNKIALGQIEVGIAGGVDSASNVPIVINESLRKILLAARREKKFGGKLKQFLKIKPGDLAPIAPGIDEPRSGLSMGGHTEFTAKFYGITREDQDTFAFRSHHNLAKAYDAGFFTSMLSPYLGSQHDNNLRRDTTIEKLSKLKPAFDKVNGTLTAGNSTPFTDGASCVLLSSESWARENGIPVLAYITHAQVSAIEYVNQKQNLLLAPVSAAARMLKRAGMALSDFDFYEIHEAFAAQVLATLKIWESAKMMKDFGFDQALGAIDMTKLNVNGGSLATAHPFAATGGRIIGTMASLLNTKGSGKGFISVCAAGGQGVTMIMEK
jgi:acetyl-CoA C-acetyltransferase